MNTYLALGDSYTIGEQVEIIKSFPYQLVQLFRRAGHSFTAPEIIAKTGWTSDELISHLEDYRTLEKYTIVSLLIGVNNQYRGRNVNEFKPEFRFLLNKAISYAHDPSNVFVVSIPDWGVTPFAEGRDRKQIAVEIDDYNGACKEIAEELNIQFIEITNSQREDGTKDEFLAGDKLHPSAMEYGKWAEKIFNKIDRGDKVMNLGISRR